MYHEMRMNEGGITRNQKTMSEEMEKKKSSHQYRVQWQTGGPAISAWRRGQRRHDQTFHCTPKTIPQLNGEKILEGNWRNKRRKERRYTLGLLVVWPQLLLRPRVIHDPLILRLEVLLIVYRCMDNLNVNHCSSTKGERMQK